MVSADFFDHGERRRGGGDVLSQGPTSGKCGAKTFTSGKREADALHAVEVKTFGHVCIFWAESDNDGGGKADESERFLEEGQQAEGVGLRCSSFV